MTPKKISSQSKQAHSPSTVFFELVRHLTKYVYIHFLSCLTYLWWYEEMTWDEMVFLYSIWIYKNRWTERNALDRSRSPNAMSRELINSTIQCLLYNMYYNLLFCLFIQLLAARTTLSLIYSPISEHMVFFWASTSCIALFDSAPGGTTRCCKSHGLQITRYTGLKWFSFLLFEYIKTNMYGLNGIH